MRFEEKTEYALLGEKLVQVEIVATGDCSVKPNTGQGFEDGFGIRFASKDGTEVVPDLQCIKHKPVPGEHGLKKLEFFVEVKVKSLFACFENAQGELRTGIDRKKWDAYLWYAANHQIPVWLAFVHPLPFAQYSAHQIGNHPQARAGIYMEHIQNLSMKIIKQAESDRMVYWRIKDLLFRRSHKALSEDPATAPLWAQLIVAALNNNNFVTT